MRATLSAYIVQLDVPGQPVVASVRVEGQLGARTVTTQLELTSSRAELIAIARAAGREEPSTADVLEACRRQLQAETHEVAAGEPPAPEVSTDGAA